MPEKEVKAAATPETVAKADYDQLMTEYQKLANAFSKLLKEFNDLHVARLFESETK